MNKKIEKIKAYLEGRIAVDSESLDTADTSLKIYRTLCITNELEKVLEFVKKVEKEDETNGVENSNVSV